ncbi:MAG: hypothetical protein ABI475_04700 [Methylophilaceae bacterium]
MTTCAYRAQLICLLGFLAISFDAAAASTISVQIGQIESAVGQARNVTLDYRLGHQLKLKAQIKARDEQQWLDASLACEALTNPQAGQWRCQHGKLISALMRVPFSLTITRQNRQGLQQIDADLALQDASFSDVAGLHAGEKITGKVRIKAQQQSRLWQWQTAVDWSSGEVFWQPFYVASVGHHLQARGQWSQQLLTIENADLNLKNVGNVSLNAQLGLPGYKVQSLSVSAPSLDLAMLYPLVLKPLAEKTVLNNAEMAGKASVRLEVRNGEPRSFQLDLQGADIDDKNGKFALYKLNASIPWSYDDIKAVKLAYQGGHLLNLPLGAADLSADLNRYALTSPQLKLPIMDGALTLLDVSAARVSDQWHWHLRANLAPVAMSELSHALGWPRMQGKISAAIPLVTYTNGQLRTDGAMQFNIFDGKITVNNLAMQTPLGLTPKLMADLHMRNLDLGDLTRAFSFGAIEGKLDGDVSNLELANWQLVKFVGVLRSSPGRYPKKISQRAVENISDLGGAGATAALQRSFLRFFKNFNYDKIGLSCRLRGDVCEMDGIETDFNKTNVNKSGGGYVIVKGSGVPAITVLGYNHSVSWPDLIERLKRITAGNTKPVIK